VNGRRLVGDLKVVIRTYLRNPVALFFSLFFPIILIVLFGAILGGNGTISTPLAVENLDHNSLASQEFLSALNNTSLVRITMVNYSVATFGTALGNNGYTAGLIIPDGFQANYSNHSQVTVELFTDPQDSAGAGAAYGAVNGVVTAFNLHAACASCSPVLSIATANVGSQVYKEVDYLIPGLIGFTILTSPMFSMVDIAASYRKDGIFRELSLTPLTRAEWLTSRIIWYVLLTFLSAGIMIGTGIALFSAHVQVTAGLLPFLFAGPFLFVSLGMLAGTVAKTPESAALIGNVITFPMMFLSGTFFAVSLFPAWLQPIARVLPLYYVIDGMNQVMLFSNASRAVFDLVVVLAIALVFFLLAIRFFTWRDE
jgi:ABC-2 type transport system permease protein